MSRSVDVVGPKLWAAMEALFRQWVREDRFVGKYRSGRERPSVASVRELIQNLNSTVGLRRRGEGRTGVKMETPDSRSYRLRDAADYRQSR